jgi:drug/metabolite transporter (DMT)-like permease
LYGTLGFFGTGILRENISISNMLCWRFLIAGVWMLCVVMKPSAKKPLQAYNKRNVGLIFALIAVGYAGSSVFYFIACQYTGTGLAMVIFFSYPIMVALSSWLVQKKQLSLGVILSLTAMVVGLFLLQDTSTPDFSFIGILFGMLGAACYTFYVIVSKHVTAHIIDSNILTTLVCFGCAAIFLVMSLISHSFVLPQTLKSWLYILAVGILATALPIQLMLKGLKYISSMRASIISVVEPLVTVFAGVLLLQESITSLQFVGITIVLISALLVQFQKEL